MIFYPGSFQLIFRKSKPFIPHETPEGYFVLFCVFIEGLGLELPGQLGVNPGISVDFSCIPSMIVFALLM